MLQKIIDAYKFWHSFLEHIPKLSRYTLGVRIDTVFVELSEDIFSIAYAGSDKKSKKLGIASVRLDRLKFLLKLAWNIGALDTKKYAAISIPLAEIGRIIGGWKQQLKS